MRGGVVCVPNWPAYRILYLTVLSSSTVNNVGMNELFSAKTLWPSAQNWCHNYDPRHSKLEMARRRAYWYKNPKSHNQTPTPFNNKISPQTKNYLISRPALRICITSTDKAHQTGVRFDPSGSWDESQTNRGHIGILGLDFAFCTSHCIQQDQSNCNSNLTRKNRN